ncbi:MAG: hypothetical protein WCY89_05470 [Flavobacteriaceae bacterium]
MRFLSLIFVAFLVLSTVSCREDFEFTPSKGKLEFSRDTVYLDTVFTNIGSSTYTLKVYNRSSSDILIPSVRLGEGENSKYRLMVDGMSGKVFQNVELLAKDSLFVFIETTIDYNEYTNSETSFLYTDKIEFDSGSNYQKVELVTLVQDAVFLYPHRDENGVYETLTIGDEPVYGFFLDENDPVNGNELVWTNEKPYVIYGYAAVGSGKTLEVQPGAKVHFHDSSGLIVAQNASLQVNGTLEEPVIFEGDRLEPFFAEVPGQWDTVWLTSGSVNNKVSNAIIKNSIIGFWVQDAPLELENTQIYNSSNFGIMAQTGVITAFNTVIGSAGQSSVALTIGGDYHFTHSTIGNFWNRSSRTYSALILDNTYETIDGFLPLSAQFDNCIVFGANNLELNINKAENSVFNYNFNHSLLKFIDTTNRFADNPLYDFDNAELFQNCLISESFNAHKAEFANTATNDFRILETSAAKATANWNISSGTQDILGNPRTNPSDMGAYNFTILEE